MIEFPACKLVYTTRGLYDYFFFNDTATTEIYTNLNTLSLHDAFRAVKAFAFSPVEDGIAVRQLLFTLLATALIVPYFKRSSRVKATFVNP